jgi:hypothetical protein
MFSKVFITALALVGAVSAVPTGSGSGGSTTPSQQCCQNVQNSSSLDSTTKGLLGGLLSVVLSGLNVPIGTGCTPIAVLGGVQCNQNTVNCGQTVQSEYSLCRNIPCSDGLLSPVFADRDQLRSHHHQRLSMDAGPVCHPLNNMYAIVVNESLISSIEAFERKMRGYLAHVPEQEGSWRFWGRSIPSGGMSTGVHDGPICVDSWVT